MERSALIQILTDRKKYKTYMEIGVSGGRVFFAIKCRNKIAVDPKFRFNWKGKLGEIYRNSYNINNRYFELRSDTFFASEAALLFRNTKVDICLVDGMHEFRFALNDVINTLTYLSNDGVIIMHDCNPHSAETACSFQDWEKRNFSGFWHGDVWKTIVYLRTFMPELNVFVADCDEGLGIITRGINAKPLSKYTSFEEIERLSYDDLAQDRVGLLNLQSEAYLLDFIKQFAGADRAIHSI